MSATPVGPMGLLLGSGQSALAGNFRDLPGDSTTCHHLPVAATVVGYGLTSRCRLRRVLWKVFLPDGRCHDWGSIFQIRYEPERR